MRRYRLRRLRLQTAEIAPALKVHFHRGVVCVFASVSARVLVCVCVCLCARARPCLCVRARVLCAGPDFRERRVYKVKCDLCGAGVPRQVEKDPETREVRDPQRKTKKPKRKMYRKTQIRFPCGSGPSGRARVSPPHRLDPPSVDRRSAETRSRSELSCL